MYINGGIAEVEKCRGGDLLSTRAIPIAVVFNDKRAKFGIKVQP